jgi:hypothetical protein
VQRIFVDFRRPRADDIPAGCGPDRTAHQKPPSFVIQGFEIRISLT